MPVRMLFNLIIMATIAQPRLIYFPEIGRDIVATPDQAGLTYAGEDFHCWQRAKNRQRWC